MSFRNHVLGTELLYIVSTTNGAFELCYKSESGAYMMNMFEQVNPSHVVSVNPICQVGKALELTLLN